MNRPATERLSDNYRTLEQQAKYLNLHPGSLRRMRLRREAPPALKLGNRLYFPKEATEAWLRLRLEGDRRNG